jgi:hypothetical protein
MWRVVVLVAFVGVVLVVSNGKAENDGASATQTTYKVRSTVMGAAGTRTSDGILRSYGTMGQPTPAGTSASGNASLKAGVWPDYRRALVTGITDEPEILTNRLYQNYPNPFNPSTVIEFSLSAPSPVDMRVFNVKGQQVRRLVDETKPAGRYRVTWNGQTDTGETVASGVYFYRLRIGGKYNDVKKMVFLK